MSQNKICYKLDGAIDNHLSPKSIKLFLLTFIGGLFFISLGYLAKHPNFDAYPFWFGNGFVLLSLLINNKKDWFYLIIGYASASLIATNIFGDDGLVGFKISLLWMLCDISEPLLAAFIIKKWTGEDSEIDVFNLNHFYKILLGPIPAMILVGLVGSYLSINFTLKGFLESYGLRFSLWVLTTYVGIYIPVILGLSWWSVYHKKSVAKMSFAKKIELCGILISIAFVSFLYSIDYAQSKPLMVAFAAWPLAVWAGVRFTLHFTAILSFLAAVISILFALSGWGIFAADGLSPYERLVVTEVFIIVLTLSALIISVTVDVFKKSLLEISKSKNDHHKLYEKVRLESRLKDEFLSSLSHELRTPLGPILGWSELLKNSNLEEMPPEEISTYINVIHRNALSELEVVNQILDLSKVITGNFQLKHESFLLYEIIEEAIDAISFSAVNKEILIEKKIFDTRIKSYGDRSRLKQVIWNILQNAVKFTPENGMISISLMQEGHKAIIKIKDNGAGISPNFLPHVFDRFRQYDGSHTRVHGGLGIGLALSKHIVELHGGDIVANSLGLMKGAEFSLSLYVAKDKEAIKYKEENKLLELINEFGRDNSTCQTQNNLVCYTSL